MIGYEIAGKIHVQMKRMELETKYYIPIAKKHGNMIYRELFVYVLPKEIRDKLEDFDHRFMARQKFTINKHKDIQETLGENSMVEWTSGYLSESKWEQFQSELKQWEAEYFQLRDEILGKYEGYVTKFIKGFLAAMVKPEHRRRAEFELKCTIPSREKYGKSFEVVWEKE